MRYFIPLLAVVLVATIFPNNSIALAAYVAIALYSAFLASSLFRKSSSPTQHQALMVSTVGVVFAIGIGVFLYFR